MFLLNSCLGLFSAAGFLRHPFSRSYGVILPSSLTILLSPALEFSSYPPVSVFGTGIWQSIAAFLDSLSTHFATSISLWITHSLLSRRFSSVTAPVLSAVSPFPLVLPFCVPAFLLPYGTGIFYLLSIDYAFQPRLRPWLTLGRRTLPRNPLSFGEWDSHPFFVTHTGILTSKRSSSPHGPPSSHLQRSPTTYANA